MKNLFIIVPARLNSSRLPNKVLKKINKKTLIQHIWEELNKFPNVFIATDSKKIKDEVKKFNASVITTKKTHINGSERCAEAAKNLNLDPYDIVINIQCDELKIKYSWIKKIYLELSKSKSDVIVTLSSNLGHQNSQFWEKYNNDQSNVRVIINKNNIATEFMRANNKFFQNFKKNEDVNIDHHLGVYGYRVKTLNKISKLKVSLREKKEKLEQLRWIENKLQIKCVRTEKPHFGFSINTKEDLERLKKKNIL